MKDIINRWERLLLEAAFYQDKFTLEELAFKTTEGTWSGKEILGHLIDSGINNLQRFTEIQYMPKPYMIRKYQQNELVVANRYQLQEVSQIVNMLMSINRQMIYIVSNLDQQKLAFEVMVGEHQVKTLEWLIKDYVEHLEHHLHQVKERCEMRKEVK